MNSEDQSSLTERVYWERTWQSVKLPRLVDLSDRSLANHGNIAIHNFFSDILRTLSLRGGSLIEVGCAQSKWLPYFAAVHGLAVTGLDYSDFGCARARALLQQARCRGEVIQADVFNPPDELRSRFDVVLSMGLVEHFADTASAISACAALARPGGTVITTIPNMRGIVGFGQRWLDRNVYNKHVPLDREALRAAHEKCGLSIMRSEYLLAANFLVINHTGLKSRLLTGVVRGVLVAATGGVWALESMGAPLPATRIFSPYVACVASKGGGPATKVAPAPSNKKPAACPRA